VENIPWYRQFWPWFLIALPATVVVAGLSTWWIAARNADSLVVDDYYKDGLAINQRLFKQERARELGISARLEYLGDAIEVTLAGEIEPPALALNLLHPMDADLDQQLSLAKIQPGVYRARLSLPTGSRWIWQLEPLGIPGGEIWRVDGELTVRRADAD
jgi:hypothetical protein